MKLSRSQKHEEIYVNDQKVMMKGVTKKKEEFRPSIHFLEGLTFTCLVQQQLANDRKSVGQNDTDPQACHSQQVYETLSVVSL